MVEQHTVGTNGQAGLIAGSYRSARQVLEDGLQALGGLEAISEIRNVTIVENGTHYEIDESPSADPPSTTSHRLETTIIDLSKARLFHDIKHTWLNYTWRPRTIINGDQSFRVDMWSKRATPITAPSLRNYPQLFQKLPHFLLQDILTERAASLRWVGEVDQQGQKQQVITFIDRDGRQVALYFDAQTHLLAGYNYLYTDCRAGDSIQEVFFPSYRSLGQFQVPTGLIMHFANEMAQDIRYERVEINSELDDTVFVVPPGIELATPSTQPMPSTITQIANDVYLIPRVGNFNNILAIAFNDYILVVEAPETRVYSAASEKVIATLKETLPGKPIKYLVITHHHLDHGCGIRAYIAEGTTIVTTPGNQAFVERVAATPFTLKADSLANSPRQPNVELITNKKYVFRDEQHVVELYDIGPYWHANEELIVYLPQEKLLYEGDLFTSGFGDDVPVAQENVVLLAAKIQELGLDVETIVGVHGRPRPIADLYKSIKKREQMAID